MDWTANYRQIMAEMAAEDGRTYEEVHADLPGTHLLMVDGKLWRKRYITDPIKRLLGR